MSVNHRLQEASGFQARFLMVAATFQSDRRSQESQREHLLRMFLANMRYANYLIDVWRGNMLIKA